MSSLIYIVSLYQFQIGPSQAWHYVVWYSKEFYDMVGYDETWNNMNIWPLFANISFYLKVLAYISPDWAVSGMLWYGNEWYYMLGCDIGISLEEDDDCWKGGEVCSKA